MLTNTLFLAVLLSVAAILAIAAIRAWRSPRRLMKAGGSALATVGTLLCAVAAVASIRGMTFAYRTRTASVPTFAVERTPERVARGEHIARTLCADCHSTNGDVPLHGGTNLSERAQMPLGNITPYNLTPAGPLKDWSDGEIFRALRNAAARDGRALVVMSGQGARRLSDDDAMSVIAFLRSQAPVERPVAEERLSFLTTIFAGAGMLPLDLSYRPEHITSPPKAPTPEYGEYVVGWAGCKECHGPELRGGGGGVLPKGVNLQVVKGWTREQFIATLRSGVDPFGKKLDPELMPWKFMGRMDDDELAAIHEYLKSLPTQTVASR